MKRVLTFFIVLFSPSAVILGGITPTEILVNAVKDKDLILAREALEKGGDPNAFVSESERNRLFHFISNDLILDSNLDLVKLLLEFGGDLSLVNRDGMTAGDAAYYWHSFVGTKLIQEWIQAKNDEYTFDDLRIQIDQANSFDELLPNIPEEIRKRSVLAYKSNSLQEASDLHPRAILFGKDLILAFNGNPSQQGYHQLEVIEFKSNRFDFYEVDFSRGQGIVSSKNPKKCMQCHMPGGGQFSGPRPNWNSYPVWVGFYGSADDNFSNSRGGQKLTRNLVEERTALKEFLASDFSETRYRHLPGLRQRFNLDLYTEEVRAITERKDYNASVNDAYRPNLEFTYYIFSRNVRRIAAEIQERPQYSKYKYLVQMALRNCEEDLNAILPEVFTEKTKNSVADILEQKSPDHRRRITYQQLQLLAQLDVSLGTQFTDHGAIFSNWSTSFNPDNFLKGSYYPSYFNGKAGATEPESFFFFMGLLDSDLTHEGKVLDCASLRKKHQEMLSKHPSKSAYDNFDYYNEKAKHDLPVGKDLKRSLKQPRVIQECIDCHHSVFLNSQIDFNDPEKLRRALRMKAQSSDRTLLEEIEYRLSPGVAPKLRMPIDTTLSESDRDELLNYLRELNSDSE